MQLRQHVLALGCKQRQDDLRVGGRAKHHTPRLEVTPQCTEVIDFAVKGDYITAAARRHRLDGPGIEIKNGEALMAEDRALRLPDALVVRTATAHTLKSAAQCSTIQRRLGIPERCNEAAH